MAKGKVAVKASTDERYRKALLHKVRALFAIQGLRKATGNRAKAVEEAELDTATVELMHTLEVRLGDLEAELSKNFAREVKGVPIYDDWLKPHVKGIEAQTAAYLLALINIENCHTPSQLWSWAGLGIAKEATCGLCGHRTWVTSKTRCPAIMKQGKRGPDGEEDEEDEDEEDEDAGFDDLAVDASKGETKLEVERGRNGKWLHYGAPAARRKVWVPDGCASRLIGKGARVRVAVMCNGPLTFTGNSGRQRPAKNELYPYVKELKRVLLGVIGTNFKKQGGYYYAVYLDHKHRLESAVCAGTLRISQKHVDNRATRYMVKCFTADLWRRWRESEGLAVRPPYVEEKLGHEPSRLWLGPEGPADPAGDVALRLSVVAGEKAAEALDKVAKKLGEDAVLTVQVQECGERVAELALRISEAHAAGDVDTAVELGKGVVALRREITALEAVATPKKAKLPKPKPEEGAAKGRLMEAIEAATDEVRAERKAERAGA